MATIIKSNKVLSVFSLVMINVIAVDSLRTLPISAQYGFTIVAYYFLAGLLFFVPSALVSAELATGWPKTGGVYVWTREAFGVRTAFLIIWLQWIYNVVWYPTILSFIAATLVYAIDPSLADNKFFILSVILTLFWSATLANMFGMRTSGWISTISALIGTLLPMAIIISLGALWLWHRLPLQTPLGIQQLLPHFQNPSTLSFLAVIIFSLMGMEMSAVHAEDVKNPQRDYPRALFFSVIIIIGSLTLASLAIALVVPQQKLNLVSGLAQAFAIFFQAYHLGWMMPLITLFIIFGGLGCVAAWVIGPTKGLMIAADDGCLPLILDKKNRLGVPVNILLLQALIFTALCSVFILMPSVSSSYWLLSDLTAQLALIFYIILFAAAIRLRYKYPEVKRSFKIPGGNFGMWLTGGIGLLTCLSVIILGFIPPEQIVIGGIKTYETILLLGMAIFCGIPFIILWKKYER